MFDKYKDRDWAVAALTAALGAGIVTTIAVNQGQNPFVALGVTAFATVAALIVDLLL